MTRTKMALRHLRRGVRFGYPICCVVRYSLDTFAPHPFRALVRGAVKRSPKTQFVPCGIFHKHDPDRPPNLDLLARMTGAVQ